MPWPAIEGNAAFDLVYAVPGRLDLQESEANTASRRFRGKNFHITVKNNVGAQKGVVKITVNGHAVEGNLITDDMMKQENKVIVEMG